MKLCLFTYLCHLYRNLHPGNHTSGPRTRKRVANSVKYTAGFIMCFLFMLVLVSPILRVSEAARTGDVSELKRVLDAETIVKRDFLLKTRTDGATPLIVAARNGNTAIVQCLLNDYDVDLEQEGTVKIDGDLIECCTPLWMASLGGHLAIVRLLLERGAEVNHTTLTNSTPLRAASFNGHTEVQTKRHLCLNYSH